MREKDVQKRCTKKKKEPEKHMQFQGGESYSLVACLP